MPLTRQVSERGQAIILFVGIFSVILVMAAIVVDFGLWFAERRSAQRGADLAAAAAAQDLPLSPDLAFTSACAWAEANGFDYTDGDVEVFVKVFERDRLSTEQDCETLPEPPPTPACGSLCDTVRVTVSKGAPRLFTALDVFSIGEFEIGAEAVAGLTFGAGGVGGVGPDQTVLLMQTHVRLIQNSFCTGANVCALDLLLDEASRFVDVLAGGAGAEVGYAPYTRCYRPDLNNSLSCVSRDLVVGPTDNVDVLRQAVDETEPVSGGAENICLPLLEAYNMLSSTPNAGRQSVILISDGNNAAYYDSSEHWRYPPLDCRPQLATREQPFPGRCDPWPPRAHETDLDKATLAMAKDLKDDLGVEIYVIALWSEFSPCGLDVVDIGEPDCDDVGNSDLDDVANERLLRCIASSPEHYQSVNFIDLPGTIAEIAAEIVSRSLLQ